MMPAYMESYPHQRNQMPFPQFYYPRHDNIPPHMMVDHCKPPVVYESWPRGNNYSYPMPSHGCCNHCNFPGYYGFRPTFSHFPPAPPSQYCGPQPPFHEPFPFHYAPPPHHAMEQQRYEYDKEAHRDYHCCGCPNHMSNQRMDKSIKIEEQEPDMPKKSDSLVPIQSKSYPYPIVWIPPEYMKKNDEHRIPFESEVAEQVEDPRNTQSQYNLKPPEGKPREWNGWFPLDLNSLKSLMQGEDERRKQNQQNEKGLRQFSHPIVWMPSNNEQREHEKDQRKENSWLPQDMNRLNLMQGEDDKRMENQLCDDKMRQFPYPSFWMPFQTEQGEPEKKYQREMNDAATSAEEPPSGFKFRQLKPPESDDSKKISESIKENPGSQAKSSQMMEGSAKRKIIPVKQVETHLENKADSTEKKVAADNSSGTRNKRQSSSPPKTSKLPPVCLRLEPLSRKKNRNGCSRSPSPSLKTQSQDEAPKPSSSSSLKEKTPQDVQAADVSLNMSGDMDPKKGEQKAIHMVDGKTCENKNEHLKIGNLMENSTKLFVGSQENVTGKPSMERGKYTDGDLIGEDGVRCKKDMTVESATEENELNDSAEPVIGESKAKKKNLSDVQAAVFIQSAYRGFEVRKLEPLKKLKQIAEVRQQVAEIRNRVQALESYSDLQKNDKERVVIGEMIMGLLLKLDTIQGLHPSLRDMRKALAKDLVTLQEELDSSMKSKEVIAAEVANDSSIDIRDETGMQNMENKVVGILENSSETSHDNVVNMKEQDQGKLSSMVDLVLNSQSEETSESALGDKEVQGRCEQEMRGLPVRNSTESLVQDEYTSGGVDVYQLQQPAAVPVISEKKDSSADLTGEQLQDSCDDPKAVNEAQFDGVNGGIHVEENPEAESTELPLKMIDEEPPVTELENVESAEKGKSEIVDVEVKSHMLASPSFPTKVDNKDVLKTANIVDPETNLIAELPIGVLEENQAVENRHSETDPETNLVAELPVGVVEGDLTIDDKQSETENSVAELPLEEDEAVNNKYAVASNSNSSTESEDAVKIMVGELPVNVVIETEENPPLSSIEGEERSNNRRADFDKRPSPEPAGVSVSTWELEGTKDQQVVDGNKEEEVLEKEPQCHEPENVIDKNKMGEVNEPEISTEGVLAATPTSQMSADEMKSDRKLIEENAKLREMMEKLMEAGKEQLAVISQLTGRVKDLERKLSRKKKLRTARGCKRAPPSTSGRKLFNGTIMETEGDC